MSGLAIILNKLIGTPVGLMVLAGNIPINRPQVHELRHLVFQKDPVAFVVIGQGHTAYGEGFQGNR